MKIVVTDGYTINPGDLSWEWLEELGDCVVYERSTYEENLERCKDAEIAVTNKVVFDRKAIDKLGRLECICEMATGYNNIDIEAAKERGIVVMNVPAYSTDSVVQMVFAHLLELTQNVGNHSRGVHEGRWSESKDFCYWDFPLIELSGKTIGIIGFGRIGKAVARIANAFGMRVLVCQRHKAEIEGFEIRQVELDRIFSESDVVSLHCPLTTETESIVDGRRLAMMKKSAFLINTGRGPLVNEKDLADALNTGRIAGAGLDVLSKEPPDEDNPLLHAKNCFITAHIGWATVASRKRLMAVVVENVRSFIRGEMRNVVV